MIEADFDSKIAQTVEKNRVLEEKIQFLEESSSKKILALEDRLQTQIKKLTQEFEKENKVVHQKLTETTKCLQEYVSSNLQISKLELSNDDKKLVTDALTIRGIASDFPVVLELIKVNILPKNLKECFTFMQTRGNKPNDHEVVLDLLKAGIKGDHLNYCFEFLIACGNLPSDVLLLV